MNDAQRLRLEMLQRADGFLEGHSGDFAASSKGAALITQVHDQVSAAQNFATQQQSGSSGGQSGTATKTAAYLALQDDIDAIARTARAMSDETPGIEVKFRRPRSNGDEALKTAARAFLADATPLKNNFIAYEMPADFLEDLQADLDAFEAAEGTQDTSLGTQVEATKALDNAIREGIAAVRKLDAVIRNKYRTNAALLAAWNSASHIERAPHAKTPTTP